MKTLFIIVESNVIHSNRIQFQRGEIVLFDLSDEHSGDGKLQSTADKTRWMYSSRSCVKNHIRKGSMVPFKKVN